MNKKQISFIAAIVIFLIAIYFTFFTKTSDAIDPLFFQSIDINQSREFKARVTATVYNAEKLLLAIGYESGKIDIYDGKHAQKYMSIQPSPWRADMINFSHNGKYLTASAGDDTATDIYDIENKSLVVTLSETRGRELFTSNDKYLILASTSNVKLYDLQNKAWVGSYETNGVVESLSLNDDETLLAVGTTGKVQLFAFNQPTWLQQIMDKTVTPSLRLIKTVEAHELQDWILFSWFIGDDLVTLSSFANLDIWSIPELNKIRTIPLKSQGISDAVLANNSRYLIALGVNEERKEGRFFVEQIDLENHTSKIPARLRTNFPNITKWAREGVAAGNELVFIEHAGKKLLLRVDDAPTTECKTNYRHDVTKYLKVSKYYKAFAVAQDNEGRFEVDYTWGYPSQMEANNKALEYCRTSAPKHSVNAECTIIFEGDTYVGN